MEDSSSILWVLFAVGAFIYSVVQRKQEVAKKRQGQEQEQPQHPEAWPTAFPIEPTPAARPEEPSQEGYFPTEYQTLEVIPEQEYDPDDLSAVSAETAQVRHPAAASTIRCPQPDKESLSTAEVAAQNTEEQPLSEDFDLQQAVIYSEILKPKFHDTGEW